ncbi:hypothetical protein PTNB73_09017 [Pyrenophora teres f. teres]|uniref:Uncharacterized protein n=1 Tax=Pyrenophora teres f. teres TaxID=97479 RepID=A0A6S6WF53_9PLEO|nr:hypothetical protein HRS9139_09241 [Pyrenophora teres f. teres]KAE8827263.1 hypothetical protein PTNB85_08616 [Pyrenophora teres f. teres]KAE8831441.1 hypothetical protein HRS9122_09031 [Pyrenophora teres f. teres]KAE8855116.1 hypothetical protein PTNB29_09367 [Pyrenophora teres f. teres]KAE8857769.1 hypothetical protein PTNB73_09017 [Pyrenophora teres f. teres]
MTENPSKQGPTHGDTVTSATPDPTHSAKDSPLITTPIPITPGGHRGPHLPSSPFPARTPRTPGGPAVSTCTDDKDLYASVTVHTAKCTECDQRNKKTMLRCPNCTFQLCSPCYEKRVKRGKGLRHGNMATQSAIEGAATPGTVDRTVRKKPFPSTSTPTGEAAKKNVDETKDGEDVDDHKAPPAGKSTNKKKSSVNKKRRAEDSTTEDSSEDNFEPDHVTPTPSKRRRSELTFAESALATAGRTPPATRASCKSAAQEATLLPALPNPVGLRASVVDGPSRIRDLLYQHGVERYDEPLLGRREPVLSNPVANIPAIIKRGGKPRPSADEIYQNIQDKLREKMQKDKGSEAADEAANEASESYMTVSKVSYRAWTNLREANVMEGDVERQEYLCTVRGFVETAAAKYQDNIAMDEDEKKAVLHAMQAAALVWGKKMYNKLDHATQQQVRPGLMLRLDRIDYKYSVELGELMDVHAARALQELEIGGDVPASMPSTPLT